MAPQLLRLHAAAFPGVLPRPHPPRCRHRFRRHARVASEHGARVVAVDLGDAIEVARRNLPADVLTVQADAEALPFAPGSFDFVMSIGVLHHLPDTARALRSIVGQAKPGGRVRVYLSWKPERRSHRVILSMVGAARFFTTRLPHPVLHAFCYPVAALLWLAIVQPYALLSRRRATQRLADAFPLKTYADYPFGVLLNDQFDRFSAPIERRFEREEVVDLLRQAGLSRIAVWAHHGWLAEGVREPAHGVDHQRSLRALLRASQLPAARLPIPAGPDSDTRDSAISAIHRIARHHRLASGIAQPLPQTAGTRPADSASRTIRLPIARGIRCGRRR